VVRQLERQSELNGTYNLLRDMVSLPSLSGKDWILSGYIEAYLNGYKMNVLRYGDSIAAWVKGKNRRRAFIVNGHIDTVPATAGWETNPAKLQPHPFDDDKVIGLGTSDMKSGLAVMLWLAKKASESPPDCDMWFMFSDNEETDGSGSILLMEKLAEDLKSHYEAVGGLILEPTGSDFIGIGHRGDTLWQVTARGMGGHASETYPERAVAIEKLGRFVANLDSIRQQWGELYRDDMLGAPSINPTILKAGKTTNVVPESAEAVFNLRITPQFNKDLNLVRETIAKDFGLEIAQLWQPSPTKCDESADIYKVAKETGLPLRAFPGATDQFAFHAHGIPVMIYGPGDVDAMHQPNEWVRLSAMEKCRQVIGKMIAKYASM